MIGVDGEDLSRLAAAWLLYAYGGHPRGCQCGACDVARRILAGQGVPTYKQYEVLKLTENSGADTGIAPPGDNDDDDD